MGASCGQIASICAARLRTIDSSAISLACGLLGFMRASLTSVPRGRSCSSSAPRSGRARHGSLLGGHQREDVGERPPRLVLEPVLENLQPVDPVESEVAEGASHLAPGGERPGVAPVRKPERVDHALASRLRLVDVMEARFAVLADGAAEVLETRAEPLAEMEAGSHQSGLREPGLQLGRQHGLDLLQRLLRRAGELLVRPGAHDARAEDQRLDFLLVEHQRRQLVAAVERVPDAGLAPDGDAGDEQVADVPIDGPLRHLQRLGQLAGGGRAAPPQPLDDAKEPVRSPHARASLPPDPDSAPRLLTACCQERSSLEPAGKIGYVEPVLALLAIVALLAAPAPGPDDVTVEAPCSGPGGTVYVGVGATFIAAQSPGGGLSYELAIELQRVLLLIDVLGGDGVHNYGTFLANVEIGGVLGTSDWTPYLLGGVGYLARGRLVFDAQPVREHVVLTAEAGTVIGRQRRWGQIWAGLRFLVPIQTTLESGAPLPDLPWGLLTVRFLL